MKDTLMIDLTLGHENNSEQRKKGVLEVIKNPYTGKAIRTNRMDNVDSILIHGDMDTTKEVVFQKTTGHDSGQKIILDADDVRCRRTKTDNNAVICVVKNKDFKEKLEVS